MFALFAPRKLQNAALALAASLLVLGVAVSPFTTTTVHAVPTAAATR